MSEPSVWRETPEHPRHFEIRGRECTIYMAPRPYYCDRGNWLAQLWADSGSSLARDLDDADGWPRYYFGFERAKLEIEAWMKKRGQWVPGDFVHVSPGCLTLCGLEPVMPWVSPEEWAKATCPECKEVVDAAEKKTCAHGRPSSVQCNDCAIDLDCGRW